MNSSQRENERETMDDELKSIQLSFRAARPSFSLRLCVHVIRFSDEFQRI